MTFRRNIVPNQIIKHKVEAEIIHPKNVSCEI